MSSKAGVRSPLVIADRYTVSVRFLHTSVRVFMWLAGLDMDFLRDCMSERSCRHAEYWVHQSPINPPVNKSTSFISGRVELTHNVLLQYINTACKAYTKVRYLHKTVRDGQLKKTRIVYTCAKTGQVTAIKWRTCNTLITTDGRPNILQLSLTRDLYVAERSRDARTSIW